MLTLATREARRPKPPPVKPGGHPEEHFTDLTEVEKEEFTCSICYQILKECMQCVNNHKFCHSCLLVWSTTGQYANRIRCPVCRTQGYYFRNSDLDDRIGEKKVKCLMESCSWSGLLKHLASHRHTTYGGAAAGSSEDNSSSVASMPRLAQASPRTIPSGSSRFSGTGLTTHQSRADTFPTPRSSGIGLPASPSPLSSSASQESIIELPARPTRTLTLNNNRPPPVRRAGIIRNSTGPNRIVFNHSRPGTDNNNNVEDGSAGSFVSNSSSSNNIAAGEGSENLSPSPFSSLPHAPRPPSAPRPAANSVRRLPRIVNPPAVRAAGPSQPIRRYQPPEAISLSMNMPGPRGRPSVVTRETGVRGSLGEIRERLQESRSRLDNLMTSFSGELERSRAQVSEFASQRERQRQDQLEEVRELGQRLGQVAAELRRLLEHRRDAAAILSDDSSSDNDIEEF
ncbi:TNF receptor-associated factor 2 [Elysia marginata]|uniref:TNF receptor-associated factor 2 n=1 Tax=Elysia marginata TaxID=1093978 RepID=A0AAV4FUN9_9GAST|nr:TNF receptor-associated factor 2 [Elysia marginata]